MTTNVILLGILIWLMNISFDLSRIARAIENLKKEESKENEDNT